MRGKKKRRNAQEPILIQESRKHILSSSSDFFIRESYNTLRANVIFSLTDESRYKLITVTSSNPGEGKSITSLNLAISLSEGDRKVLLIDADMRKPKLNRLLGMSVPIGLSNVLMDIKVLNHAITPCEEVPNLSLLFSGSIPPNPSELLASRRMQRLLDVLQNQYDYVILDTPPVGLVTDAVVLAPQTHGVLIVVRAGQCERGVLTRTIHQLEYAQAKILGYVLNGMDLQKIGNANHRDYEQYGYGYQ